jgi:uncharacterized Tic20 family protein
MEEYPVQSNAGNPTNDEKMFALLSHLSLLLGGIILPIVIWATQKDKLQFVRFHSLQAIFYQVSFVVIFFAFTIGMLLIIVIIGGGIGVLTAFTENAAHFPFFMIIFIFLFYGGIIFISIGSIVYSVYLAIKSYNGFWIKVPVTGNIIWNRINSNRPY